MSKLVKLSFLFIFAVMLASCSKSDSDPDIETPEETIAEKPVLTTFKFASTNIDCGAYTQNRTGNMIHLNTEKCHNEVYRPTITLFFGANNPIAVGKYTIGQSATPTAGSVYISSSDYMNPKMQPQIAWVATEGAIEIVVNADDATKFDVEFKAITMHNTSFAVTTGIPEFDTLSGFIIGI